MSTPFLVLALLDRMISSSWIIPVAITAIVFYYLHRRNKMAHDTLRAMIERGQQVTPEVINLLHAKRNDPTTQSERARKDRRTGILLFWIGIGIIVVGGKPGYIVLFTGSAFLALSYLDRDGPPPPQPPQPPPPAPIQPTQPPPQQPPQQSPQTSQPPQ